MPKQYSQDKDLPSDSNFDDFSLYSDLDNVKKREANVALYEAIINLWEVADKYQDMGACDTGSRESIIARVYDLQWSYNFNQIKAALEKEKKDSV